MPKHTLKILRCSHFKIFKVCLAIFQHHEKTKPDLPFHDKVKKENHENTAKYIFHA